MSQQVLYQYLFNGEQLFALPNESFPESKTGGLSGAAHDDRKQETEIVEIDPSPFSQMKSRFVIIVNTYGKGIQENEAAFLKKVLKAVKYDLDQVDLFDLEQLSSADVTDVLQEGLADYLLLLGVKPEDVNLDINLRVYQPQMEKGVWVLMSNSLTRIEMEEALKRSLWEALKKMFF